MIRSLRHRGRGCLVDQEGRILPYAPGAENPSPPSTTTRVVRALTAGTLERRYADGKKETVNWKPGMVQVLPPSGAYTTKNVGKTKLQLYVVAVK